MSFLKTKIEAIVEPPFRFAHLKTDFPNGPAHVWYRHVINASRSEHDKRTLFA